MDLSFREKSERDRLVQQKAYRAAYLLLAAGVVLVVGRILFGGLTGQSVTLVTTANLLLFVLVLAECTGGLGRLYHYRRGV